MDGQQPRAHPGTHQGVLGASTTARWGTTDGAQSQARVPEEEMLLAWRSSWGHGAAGLSGSSARGMIMLVVALPVASVSVSASIGRYGVWSKYLAVIRAWCMKWQRVRALHCCVAA